MNDDDKLLKDLFAAFDPELPSDTRFVDSLQRRLDSVELIRQRSAELRSRSRKAMVIAALVGFVAGMLFSFAIPYVGHAVASASISLLPGAAMGVLADNHLIITWFVIAVTSVFLTINAYDVAFCLLGRKQK